MADLYDPAFPTLDDNQASATEEGEEVSESSDMSGINSVPSKMDADPSEASAAPSEDGPGVGQEQVVPSSSFKEVTALSSETERNSGCSRVSVAPEVQTFNGSRIFVNTIHEDQEFVPSDSVCVETYSSDSAPMNHISSVPVVGGDASICSVASLSSSDVNTVVSEEIVEIPLRCELEKNSTEHVPVIAGECIVETDHVLEVSECVTVDETEKREKQPVTDETGIRRSSRIAEKKNNQKHQKNTSDNSKTVREREVKDKQSEPQESKKTSSADSKGSRCYDKEKSDHRHKSTHSYGKRGERDHTPDKSRRGSDNSDRHEHKRSESSKRENNRRDSSRRYGHRSESSKSDCDKESNRSLSSKDSGSKGNYRHRSRGQRSHSTRKNSDETSEVKNSSSKHEEHSDDQPKQKPISVDKTDKCDELFMDLSKYKRKFHVDVKPDTNPNLTHSPLIEVKPAVMEEPKLPPKKTISDQSTILKPEKVKSRWRRSSELEHGDLSSTPVTVFTEPAGPKNPDLSQRREILPTISEEPLASSNLFPEKISNLTENKEKPPYYEPIEDNLYLFERKKSKSKKEVRRMVCDCTLTEEEKERGVPGCTENCLNRLLMIECGSRCATGELCSNKRFQKKLCIKTDPFKTEKKGWGLRVLEDVAAGQFVMEYVGEVLSPQDFKHRVKQYAKEKNNHYYFMALKCDEIIDATNKGSLSRFINHSCDPNCETQKWTVNGELRIGFFTRRFVKAGDELTFDYQFQRYGKEAQKCYCESESCRGYIGDDKQISLDSYNSSKSSNRRKKTAGEKKREVLEDLSIEEELEKLQVSGGLRNREETLVLARLMVRADDVHTRNRLLDIILNTTELPCLRLFLDYHGLSLMWSWMADVVDLKLKTKILRALSLLPIPNKTMLLDSKVINLVQKWWLHHSGRKLELDKDSEITETEQSSDSPSGGTTPCGGDDSHDPSLKRNKSSSSSCESSPESDSGVSAYLRLRASDTMMFPASSISAVRIKPTSSQSSPTKCEDVEQKSDECTVSDNISEHQIIPKISNNSCGKSVNNEIKPVETITKSDEESGDTMDEEDERKDDTELSILASQLLESWSGLKEVFRIPRVEQQKRREDEDAVDHHNSERESNRCRDYGLLDHPLKEKDVLKERDVQDDHFFGKDKKHRDKWRDREKTKDVDHYNERNVVESRDWRDEKQFPKHPKKIRLAEPELQQPPRPRKVLLPTPPRLTKEERRQLFALEVQQKDQEEALRKQQEEQTCATVGYPSAEPGEYGTYNQYYNPNQYDATTYNATGTYPNPYDPNAPYPQQQVVPDCQTPAHNVALPNGPKPGILPAPRTALLPTPTFVEPIQPLPLPVPTPQYTEQSTPLQYHEQPAPLQYPEQSTPLPYHEQPAPLQYPEQSAPLTYPAPGLLLQPPPTQMPPFLGAPPPTIAQPAPVLNPAPSSAVLPPVAAPVPGMGVMSHSSGPPNVPGINPVTPAIASPSAVPLATVTCSQPETGPLTVPPIEACASPTGSLSGPAAIPTAAVPPGFLPNPAQFVNASNRPVYFVHSSSTTSVVNVRDQITIQQAIPVTQMPSVVAEGEFSSPLAKPAAAVVRLPPNWKTARDPEGNIYYYHAITRQTQWDPPTLEENEDMDLGTPTFDEPKLSKKKSTTTAAADTSSELAKKIKELFRAKMSTFIVQCLNPYRKPDCQVGRITSSDDFKHLARKLTHIVMAKELKHCKNVEHLECNDNVKMKAKDFTQKYMAKQGPVYKKESSSKCN